MTRCRHPSVPGARRELHLFSDECEHHRNLNTIDIALQNSVVPGKCAQFLSDRPLRPPESNDAKNCDHSFRNPVISGIRAPARQPDPADVRECVD